MAIAQQEKISHYDRERAAKRRVIDKIAGLANTATRHIGFAL